MNCDRLLLCCGCNKQQKYLHYGLDSRVRIQRSACVYTYMFLCFVFLCRWRRTGGSFTHKGSIKGLRSCFEIGMMTEEE